VFIVFFMTIPKSHTFLAKKCGKSGIEVKKRCSEKHRPCKCERRGRGSKI